MMDNFPFREGERLRRITKIRDEMRKADFDQTRIHFEMASFVDESLLLELTEHVVPYADSLGMNEQELPNLWSMLRHKNVSLVSDSNPRIATVLGTSVDISILEANDKLLFCRPNERGLQTPERLLVREGRPKASD